MGLLTRHLCSVPQSGAPAFVTAGLRFCEDPVITNYLVNSKNIRYVNELFWGGL